MVNRRSVLKQIGAATVAATLVEMPGLAKSGPPSLCAIQRAVFDERFAESRAFGGQLGRAGVFTSAIRGDVAKLWYEDLRVQLRQNRASVAGLTDRSALFCLEELARDVAMRVVFRMDHTIDESGFGGTMAHLISRFDMNEPRDASAQKRSGPFSSEGTTALVSWIIA